MKKLLLSLTAAALLLLSAVLTACSHSDPMPTDSSGASDSMESDTKQPQELPFTVNTFSPVIAQAGTSYRGNQTPEDVSSASGISFFALTSRRNEGLPFSIACYISDEKITAMLPSGIDRSSLCFDFTFNGEKLMAGDQEMLSGTTILDLSTPKTLTAVQKDGSEVSVELVVETLNTGLPSIVVNTHNWESITSKTDYLTCNFYCGGGNSSICSYATPELYSASGQIRGRGNSTWYNFPKKSYTVKLDTPASLLGLPASDEWVLCSNYQEKTLMRNTIASRLSEIMGLEYTMKTRSVDLWLNGKYWGNYMLIEKITIEKDRVDIPKFNPDLPVDKVGYLLEFDGHVSEIGQEQRNNWQDINGCTYDPIRDIYFVLTERAGGWLTIQKPSSRNMTPEHCQYIAEYINTIERYLDELDYDALKDCMDLESFARWYFVEDITKNIDSRFWSSCYMYISGDGVLHMGPVWDFDLSLGNANYAGGDTPDGEYMSTTFYFRHLLRIPEFREIMCRVWEETYDEILTLVDTMDELAEMLRYSQRYNFEKWNILWTAVGSNPDYVANAHTYQEQVQIMKDFFLARVAYEDAFVKSLQNDG